MPKEGSDNSNIPLSGYPDPSDATIAFVERVTGHLQDITQAKLDGVRAEVIGEVHANATRLDAMDKAAEVLAATVNQFPTNLQLATHEINATMNLRFQAVEDHFTLVDKATDRQRHDAELAATALARTQERATSALALASNEAIKRSDEHTAETILKNEQAQLAGQKNLSDKIDVADQRMNRLEQALGEMRATGAGANANRDNARNNTAVVLTAVGVLIAVVTIIVTVVLTRPSASDSTVVNPPVASTTVTVVAG
jgi:hypothetical protein